jgi:hypothetical protein
VSGVELWKSDGTEAGTVPVRLPGGLPLGSPTAITVAGDRVFIAGTRPEVGAELFTIDLSEPPLPGDYDLSGVVDDLDRAFWSTNYGSTSGLGLQADGNGDGVVDAADYTVWRDNLGAFESGRLIVDSNSDAVDGVYGPGQFSLREAIELANARLGADVITFAEEMSGQTITLGGTQLEVIEALTIDARPLAVNLTVDANLSSRVLRIDDPNSSSESFAVTLAGLNFVNGRTVGPSPGAAIRSLTSGLLTLVECTVADSRTADADGGGLWACNLRLESSTVSGNETRGASASGGGVWATTLVVDRSTISGNSTLIDGGGVYVEEALTINQSTITLNTAGNRGAGVLRPNSAASFPLTITGSILAGNTAPNAPDLRPGTGSVVTANYSLFGDTTGSGVTATTGTGNLRNVSAQLGPLADNGGPTKTHALLPGSPALNAGDPAVAFSGTQFDQRGTPFTRVSGGRIDVGAFEVQVVTPSLVGDYNLDGAVNAADYTVWRDTLGQQAFPFAGADGSGDGLIGVTDYSVWGANYGTTTPPPALALVQSLVDSPNEPVDESPVNEAFAQLFGPSRDTALRPSVTQRRDSAAASLDDDLLLLYQDRASHDDDSDSNASSFLEDAEEESNEEAFDEVVAIALGAF